MISKNKILTLIVLLVSSAWAETDISGFMKLNYLNYNSPFDSESNHELFQINRISFLKPIGERVTIEGSYELIQIYSDIDSTELAVDYKDQKRSYRIKDDRMITSHQDYFLTHNIDRLSISWNGDGSSIVLGRQQLAFGSGKSVNPTDIFTPFSFTAIDTEVRNGVDAFRFRYQLGEMGQIDSGMVLEENGDNSGAYLLTKLMVGNIEFRPMIATFKKAGMIGLDLASSLYGSSIWLESAWVDSKQDQKYLRAVVGAERQVHRDISLYLEYYYNGAGSSDSANYLALENEFAYSDGGVYLHGKNYLSLGGSIQLSPLHALAPVLISNLNDHSQFINLSWEWNSSENLYFNLGAYICLGKKSGSLSAIESEFGSSASTLFSRLRYYF